MSVNELDILVAIANGKIMGEVVRNGIKDKLRFRYDANWRSNPEAFPLSLSMPISIEEHPHERINPYLWGLLPDNREILQGWGFRYGVSPRNAFKLLQHVGNDTAGAVQFVHPDQVQTLLTESSKEESVQWVSLTELNSRIFALQNNPSDNYAMQFHGQFSLAGAQPKVALYYDESAQRWGVPSGRIPTTHIIKPQLSKDFENLILNEFFCLNTARLVGLPVPEHWLLDANGILCLVLKRYDRIFINGGWERLHQEDFCQALGYYPENKYQAEKGPSLKQMADLILGLKDSESSKNRFDQWVLFNFLLFGSDAHAKNISLFLSGSQRMKLTPFYDMASGIPYSGIYPRYGKFAWRIGKHYGVDEITLRDIQECRRNLSQPSLSVLASDLIEKMLQVLVGFRDQRTVPYNQSFFTEKLFPLLEQRLRQSKALFSD